MLEVIYLQHRKRKGEKEFFIGLHDSRSYSLTNNKTVVITGLSLS